MKLNTLMRRPSSTRGARPTDALAWAIRPGSAHAEVPKGEPGVDVRAHERREARRLRKQLGKYHV